MMKLQLPVAQLALLLPMMASCSSPSGRYQEAIVQERDGVPCFGVPDTHETRSRPPLVTSVSVTELGKGNSPVWERIFIGPDSTEPALSPEQCILYGEGGTAAFSLQSGVRYQVVISGGTPDMPANEGRAQKRVFGTCFHVVEDASKHLIRPVQEDCATTLSSVPQR